MTNLQGKLKKTLGDLYGLRTWLEFGDKNLGQASPLQNNPLRTTDLTIKPALDFQALPPVEYGFRQCKQELGWTDYRFTNFQHIEKWWEIIFCAYTMISLNSSAFLDLNQSCEIKVEIKESSSVHFSSHKQWKE